MSLCFMRRYKLIIAYDGTMYHGWQIQNNKPTIAQTLQDTFAQVFSERVTIVGVSRTDAGVHAHGQLATFTTDNNNFSNLDLSKIKYAWNNLLPPDIVITELSEVPVSFNPFYNIDYKIYCYYFFIQRPSPFVSRYGWQIRSGICLQKLKTALSVFVGTHNFQAFVTGDDRGDDTVRSIDSIDLEYDEQICAYKIIIKGPKFLRHMIRRIVGASIEVALRSDLSVNCLQLMLENHTLSRTLVSAPARGLVLHKIIYKIKD